jgi:hypothetical protein
MVADAECRSDTVDLADTHLQIKALSQDRLDGRGRSMRSLPTSFFEKSSCCSTQFAGMTVPSIGERHLAPLSKGCEQPIGIRLTDLQSGEGCGSLP